ncbi:MAG: flagellar hook-associated protein FlgK, partial [Magnetospirillum sp.]
VHNRGTTYPTVKSLMTGTRRLVDPNNPTINGGLIPAGLTPSPQKIWLSGNSDVTIAMFDTSGNEVASSTLKSIMSSTAYADAAGAFTSIDISATPAVPGVKLTDVAAKIQSWMQAQTYQNNALSSATASIASGTFVVNTANTAVTLGFRDQVSSTKGATAGDATIKFDVDGDGKADQSVDGFSNFFGLNDLFTQTVPHSIADSQILDVSYTQNTTRTFRLLDPSGQIGNAISVSAGASLSSMATTINNQTQTNDSSVLSSTALTLTSNASISISDANGTISGFPISLTSGATTDLNVIAAAIDAVGGSVQAKVVQNGPGAYQLRVWDSRGQPLTMDVSGGTIGTSNLGDYLGMKQTHLIQATVIPEGSGYRLRIRQTADQELFVGATPDSLTPPGSIITDLNLAVSATRSAGTLNVRADIQGSPSLISRGAIQYNADLGKYSLAEGDNTTIMAIAKAMADKTTLASAGNMYAGSYNLAEYGAASIAVLSTNAAHSKEQQTYQTSLGQSLNTQYTSFSGVNLDEEVANMINFQQAYSASAKVIATLQEMLDTLVNTIR